MLVVTKLHNMSINDHDANTSARYSQVLVGAELVVAIIFTTFKYFSSKINTNITEDKDLYYCIQSKIILSWVDF